ncbi:non-ribosomal peptide synthetase [Pseudonocardia endophytica]|uniref:Phenyloxazoline synthase MbtB n=1 Tax=Pseudonocardia endophytica TaxID=401976 RepID=A0A4R1HTZ7_PSEEN|nr:non-ribosomal peptide synthetase [Pseudonocardia endophytica]TCK25718.1 pyochelin synthetase [Pseudonocardia endophytica]
MTSTAQTAPSAARQDVAALVREIEELGVRLWTDDGRLRFRAPRGVITDELRERLRENRTGIVEHLSDDRPVIAADPDAAHAPFPLTDVQSAYLLGRRDAFGYGGVACHAYLEAAFTDLDPARLQDAWRALVARHGMLRAVVHPDGHQQVLPEVPDYEIAVDDLRGAGQDAVDAAVARTRAELDHRVHPTDRWPLFDLRVTRSDGRALLHLSIDLLIADYASVQLLLAELDRLYREPETPLPPLEIGFRDHVLAVRGRAGGPAHERDRAYWAARIDDLPPAPELPVAPDAERAAGVVPRFRRWRDALTPSEWTALRDRAAAEGISPTGALTAAYAEVIGRWSRHPRFTLNLTLLGRPPVHPQVGALVGDFTSVTLLAVEQDRSATFRERAGAVAAQLFEDMDHRSHSGIEVIREIARRRGRREALMPVVFTSAVGLNADEHAEALTGQGTLVHGITQTPQVWLDCQVLEHHGALQISWDVRDGVLPDAVVDDMFAAYVALVRALARDAGTWRDTCPVGLPPAQAQRRAEVNDTAAPLPDERLHDGFVARARQAPDEPAVVTSSASLSYADVAAGAGAVAQALRAVGHEPGGIVGVLTERGPEQVLAVLGTTIVGGVYLPVDTNQPPARRDALLADAGVRTVLTQSWLSTLDLPAGIRVIAVDRLGPSTDVPEPAAVDPDDLAYVIYTSGSTGAPKGVMTTHRAAVNTVADINRRFRVGPGDRVLGLAQLGFDLSVYDVFGTLAAGATLVLPDPDRRGDPSHWARLAAATGVTVWNSVPAQLQMLEHYLAAEDPADPLPSVRLALLSGDWIPVTLPAAIASRLPGCALVSLGGATEAAIWSIVHPIGDVPDGARSVPYGTPLTNQTFHVLDGALDPVPDLVPGELYIGGAGLARGYLGDPERTAERFVRHPVTGERLYRTGDLGRYLPDGVIEFLGREDDQVKIRGHRIELAEVEAALTSHPAVGAAAVVVDDDPGADRTTRGLDRRLAAFAEPQRAPRPDDGFAAQLAAAATAAGADATRDLDRSVIVEFSEMLDAVCLLSMAHAFRRVGLFPDAGPGHLIEEIQRTAEVAPPHRRQVRRWLATLRDNGMISHDPVTGRWHDLTPTDDASVAAAWEAAEAVQAGLVYPDELMRYFRACTDHLPALLRDDQGPMQLMFPDGGLETADAAYRNNLYARYLNRAVIAAVEMLVDRHTGPAPLRVLEIGAGVGGTSNDLVPALARRVAAGADVEYTFTDISHFFLNEARERFRDLPWMRYGIFDIDEPFREQGLTAGTYDVVVAANVMHNARHVGRAVEQFSELLVPGGVFVMLESTKEHHEVMVSMEFMMEFDESRPDFSDVRAGQERVFVLRDEWSDVFAAAGGETAVVLPAPDDELSVLGQNLFVTRFRSDRVRTDVESLRAHLAHRLPEHMIPSHLELVGALPLSGTGKVDRRTLTSWLPSAPAAATASGGAAPRTETERLVATLWAQVLGTTGVGRDDDFFRIGGDSLLVAQLVGALRTQLPAAADLDWDGLLRQMLNEPTVAALAAHLDATQAGGAPPAASPVIPMGGSGASRAEPVRVLVHEGLGSIAPYRPLAARLAGHGPVIGLAVPSAEAYLARDPDTLIVDLAAEYAELLGERHERFHVVGYCMGGLLATELARKLTAGGAAVDSLSIVSSYRIPQVTDDVVLEYCYLRVMGVDPVLLGYPADEAAVSRALRTVVAEHDGAVPPGAVAGLAGRDGLGEVAGAFARVAERNPAERMAGITAAIAATAGAGADVPEDVLSPYRVFRHAFQATAVHEPVPYDGDVTFLRQHGANHFLPELAADMTEFWRTVCTGRFTVHDIGGDHFTCMSDPHADELSRLVLAAQRGGSR